MTDSLSYTCPFCGSEVRVGKPCTGCLKKAAKLKKRPLNQTTPEPKKRSWEEPNSSDGLNLPDEDFDYDEFVSREFGKSPHQELRVKWYWWVLAVILLAVLVAGAFSR